MNLVGSRYGPVEGLDGQGTEHSGFIKDWDFFDQFNDCQLLKNICAP
jgi:hypothetical protein